MSDQPMVCESPLRFRLNLAQLQIGLMPKENSVQFFFRDVGQAVSEIMTFKKMEKGSFFASKPVNQMSITFFLLGVGSSKIAICKALT